MAAAETDLLERAQAGEEEAFTGLVLLYEQRLRAFARSLVRNDQDAEDLTQEAFIRIYRALPLFQRQASFCTWAFRILANLCQDYLRQRKRRPQLDEIPLTPDDSRPLAVKGPGPEEEALQLELRESLRAALSRLPMDQRVVVVLHDVCAFKYREIALIAHCSEGTVKSRLFVARMKLRNILGLTGAIGGDH